MAQPVSAMQKAPPGAPGPGTIGLRILATTDMHMHLLGHDYLADRPAPAIGLARVAAVIAAERARGGECLLVDNGDMFQGSALGECAAAASRIGLHPAIAAMNALGYDAATLGNHDFSFGPGFLRTILRGARFPVVATNLERAAGLPVRRTLLIERVLHDAHGGAHRLRIGVLGFLPPQTVEWEPGLRGRIAIGDVIAAAAPAAAALRARGADLVIALSHGGIGAVPPLAMAENAAAALAALPGIDAVIMGHTHRVFPHPDHPAGPGVDPRLGRLAGKPAVMAGFWGSHLGVIELALTPPGPGGDRWQVTAATIRAEPVAGRPECPAIAALARPAHLETLRRFRRRIGHSERPMNSHFALLGQDAGLGLVAMAQRWHVRRALAGGRFAGLPVLSAVAPFRAGGRGGPGHYTDVPAGRLTARGLADLYHFPNRLAAVLVRGADLAAWLERSASIFRMLVPGGRDQELIDPDFPGYNFDVIAGLGWQIDLAAAPRHAPDGGLLDPDSRRVRDLSHRGRPVDPDQPFVLVTNSYRLAAGGLFGPVLAGHEVLIRTGPPTREVLRRYLARRRRVAPVADLGWRFRPMPGTTALFRTAPGALERGPCPLPLAGPPGTDAAGFLLLRLAL